jgi:hypothetical protein
MNPNSVLIGVMIKDAAFDPLLLADMGLLAG